MSARTANGMRTTHRWVSLVFTAGVIVNLAANVALRGSGGPPFWVGLLALLPLIGLLVTGLYLFALPYLVARRRGAVEAS